MHLDSVAAQPTVSGHCPPAQPTNPTAGGGHCPTIAAIATPNGPGGIGIVRVSGPGAISIAESLFHRKNRPSSQLRDIKMAYGIIIDPNNREEFFPADLISGAAQPTAQVDEAICLVFRSPHSYTGEDVVELQCHGSQVVLRRVLEAVLRAGARLAEPGEFTRRAYLNGRIDLAKAEAVMQLVRAGSEQAARAAATALGGALSRRVAGIRQQLIFQAAQIAAWADYPEEEFDDPGAEQIMAVLSTAADQLSRLIQRGAAGQAVISGVSTAIVGPPNAGKSSLMNRLAGYDRSIVTEIPGTTRDTITETIQLGNLTLRLTDTAGLRESGHPIEHMGVERSQAAMAGADLVLAVFDITQPIDQSLLAGCDPARTLVVLNKCDLSAKNTALEFPFPPVACSALTGQGMDDLAQAIEALFGTADFSPNEAILANHRQAESARDALASIEGAQSALREGYPLDAVAICMEDAIQALYSLTGERATESIVDEVFASFCVGK